MIIKGTSCYENANSGNLVSITGDGGNAGDFSVTLTKRCLLNYIYGNTIITIQIS